MTPRQLFEEWLDGRSLQISEYGSAFEYADLIIKAREAAALLGMSWSDDLIPDWMTNTLKAITPD